MIVGFTVYDFLVSITFAIVAVVFYKIFVNSLVVLQDFTENRAFSIEEVIGTSLLMAIAVSCFGNLNIYGFGIRNILSILIVMFLGWKNGILVGTTSGVTIGVTIGMIANTEPIMIAAYAISGMVAGILNRFGRPGVIVGFALGNVVLAYASNGYTIELIHFKEILIASIGLLAIPKAIHINIEDFMQNGTGFLPGFPNMGLNRSKEAAENLNNVSETIQEMAKAYKPVAAGETRENNKENNKTIFITELLDCLEPYKNNILYEDIAKPEGKIVNDIFECVMENQGIGRAELLEIFEKNNNYLIVNNEEEDKRLVEDINQMVRCINMALKLSKSSYVWMKKVEETKQNMENQLNSVSKAISGIAKKMEDDIKKETTFGEEKKQITEKLRLKGIEIDEISVVRKTRFIVEIYLSEGQEIDGYNDIEKIVSKVLNEKIVVNEDACTGNKLSLISDDKYTLAVGKTTKNKENQTVSGDYILNKRLKDGKYLIALSDGMGTGKEARESSKQALEMLRDLLMTGFDKNTSIELINTTLMNRNEELFATLDIAIIDLYTGTVEMIKNGACPTYFKNNKKVQIVKSKSLPAGIIQDLQLEVYEKDIQDKDIMVMCTDGILDSNVEYKNKELWLKYLLEDIETVNTKKIADLIVEEAVDNSFGIPRDDMTVYVCKFRSKDE